VSLAPARRVALKALGEIRRREAWSRPVVDTQINAADLNPQDAALSRVLAIGTVQMLGSLDYAIDRNATRPSRLEPRVRDALRMSAYEILFMATPREVAVHQGVEAVRSASARAAGLGNAVLRRLAEDADTFPWVPTDDIAGQALLTGHPEWLVEALSRDLGQDRARDVLQADNTPPPMYLGANLAFTDDERLGSSLDAADAAPVAFGPPGCYRVDHPAKAVSSDIIETGHAIVSDAAAQTVAQLAVPVDGGTVLEVGAGRGTKTMLIASHALRRGVPVDSTCVDVDSSKLELLASRAAALGLPVPASQVLDAADDYPPEMLGTADAVLIDAPCSGLGTLRRHPEKRWHLEPDSITEMARLGTAMLARAARVVCPGGFVVYSTCTVLRAENDDVVGAFLESEEGEAFELHDLASFVPEEFEMFVDENGRLQGLPTEGGPDGHFAAMLKRGA
jgi:16S rRNA (cytosine967-C5)-methyltransferase